MQSPKNNVDEGRQLLLWSRASRGLCGSVCGSVRGSVCGSVRGRVRGRVRGIGDCLRNALNFDRNFRCLASAGDRDWIS